MLMLYGNVGIGGIAIVLALVSCTSSKTTDDGASNLGAAGTAGAGGVVYEAGAGGAVDEAGAAGIGGDAAKAPVDCAAVHGGPSMVEVSTPNGDRYCIDTTKVTQKQYAEFLGSNKASPGSEHSSCSWNTSYELRFHDDSTSAGGCYVGPTTGGTNVTESDWFSPDTTPNRAVVCIDWCDANAFCQWAGKRLCGAVGGGPVTQSTFANPKRSEWYNACSNQGATVYPYGDEYDEACGRSKDGALPDVDAASACHAASGMFSKVYGMSGLTSEWLDACEYVPSVGMSMCAVAGSSGSAEVSRCGAPGLVAPQSAGPNSGFRCCKG